MTPPTPLTRDHVLALARDLQRAYDASGNNEWHVDNRNDIVYYKGDDTYHVTVTQSTFVHMNTDGDVAFIVLAHNRMPDIVNALTLLAKLLTHSDVKATTFDDDGNVVDVYTSDDEDASE
jgi:hypothetical protein